MRRTILYSMVLLAMSVAAFATTFEHNTDPFAGTNITSIPGRQILGGEFFINFNTATDKFEFNPDVFNAGNTVHFVNTTASNLPSGGVNFIVLRTFDNDNNPLTPFGAGNAADLIADKIDTPGAGFFIYFNESLDLPRLVYSTDLSSNTADLRILDRILNFNGDLGKDKLAGFTADNFEFAPSSSSVPEPSSVLLFATGGIAAAYRKVKDKKKMQR